MPYEERSVSKKLFDLVVTRHAIHLNSSLSVRGEGYSVVDGQTLEITVAQVRKLLKFCDEATLAGLRDKAIIHTVALVGSVVNLIAGDFLNSGDQWVLKFIEKVGKARGIVEIISSSFV